MCEYCEKEKIEDASAELLERIKTGKNKPLLEGRCSTIKIYLQFNGKYLLTDGFGYVKINNCPMCGRKLPEE
ncbi:MAG: hypothetical protein K2H85_03145 [Allobaculum sp.]|nr:hypothetical protein [Allobaculum sp.]